jgi:hypothetical protein
LITPRAVSDAISCWALALVVAAHIPAARVAAVNIRFIEVMRLLRGGQNHCGIDFVCRSIFFLLRGVARTGTARPRLVQAAGLHEPAQVTSPGESPTLLAVVVVVPAMRRATTFGLWPHPPPPGF